MKKNNQSNNRIVIYQAKSGAIELKGDLSRETIWATQAQMAFVFGVNPQAITKHLKNIYKEGELSKKATCSKMEQVQIEGGRRVERSVDIYNLDAIVSVGYRISSKTGTRFRQWATKTLRSYIVDGYAINKNRIAKNYEQFIRAVENVKKFLPAGASVDTKGVLELVSMFADAWLSIGAYDKKKFATSGATKKSVKLTSEMLDEAILVLKKSLIEKDEATDLFATERERGSVAGIVGNVMQSFSGGDAYPTIEEKATHLLYFMVKNHPFIDGNKRSGAFAFIWFLRKAGRLNTKRLTPEALTALTLLVAESNPKDKDQIIGLVLMLLKK
ncbi:virulence protein RhuM/Fic/DOC family protein [Candidatus Microgenomates bacterium]|nr:virulence protein RhuM/Fic/DOC family protein [Candidatus Microgenomates bacterium]